ncbi:hypothetical protein CC80DRAFT_547648 [Byssothecium circinans]|uniref:RING-type domain-containing protein n=1 Tax=Byssothecium circinans TaxID=147558 RepID=A0A6A5TWB2_9PLEO|nr:hypothetical protein CC80DRAFT_547648 [Byssothecium circinans]
MTDWRRAIQRRLHEQDVTVDTPPQVLYPSSPERPTIHVDRTLQRANRRQAPPPVPATRAQPPRPTIQLSYARTLKDFCANHVRSLLPTDPLYPSPGTMCPICQGIYSASHPPVVIIELQGCRGHVFGYGCLRKWIASGRKSGNKCPLCRSKWFNMRAIELREVARTWARIEKEEDDAVRRDEEAFGATVERQNEVADGYAKIILKSIFVGAFGWVMARVWG